MFEPPQGAASYVPLESAQGDVIFQAPQGAVPEGQEEKVPLAEESKNLLKATIANRPTFAHVSVELDNNAVVGDYGAMIWMNSASDAIAISTSCSHLGGCCAGYWRTCARESCCLNQYSGTGEVSFAFDLPGDIIPFMCGGDGRGWVLTKGGFVCGTPNVRLSSKWKGCAAFHCSGEGGMLTYVTSGDGNNCVFFAGGFGAIQAHDLKEGQSIKVNTGLFFAGYDDVPINVGWPGGCKSYCYSGEGWIMIFEGPTRVYTQSRDPEVFMALLNPHDTQKSGNNEDGGGGE